MKPISVLLVDDNPTFLRIASRFLQEHEEINVVGSIHGGKHALAQIQALRPDVVLIDLAMPDRSGLEVILSLRAALPETGIIALTLLDTNGYRHAALTAGADEFIPKGKLNSDLLPAIQRVTQICRLRKNSGSKSNLGQTDQGNQKG